MKVNLILSFAFLILSISLTKMLCVVAQGTRLMDKPNHRSMHSQPTVRGGGLIFIALALFSIPVLCYTTHTSLLEQLILIVSILMVAIVSFMDDLYQLSARLRFLVQSGAALLITLSLSPSQLDLGLLSINYPLLVAPFVFITALWAINHFNFMDGLDGFCASQAVFLFAGYAVLFGIHDASFYQDFCLLFIASLSGFLLFNFPPAKLFMGDIGSASLGLITFCVALIAQQKFHIPIAYWFMLNGLFLFDATTTLVRRVIHKEKWSAPHKKHAYQRLRQSGVKVPVILLGQFLINCSFLVLVLFLNMNIVDSCYIITLQIGFIFMVYCVIEKIFPMFQSEFSS